MVAASVAEEGVSAGREAGVGIRITVVYALPAQQWERDVELAPGGTVGEALLACGLLRELPELALARAEGRVVPAVHHRVAADESILADGDRVELVRPLQLDPFEARRRRAAAQRAGRPVRPG